MSRLAIFFVIFNLILTVVFFGTSATLFSTRKNYLDLYDKARIEYVAQLDALEAQMKQQAAQIGNIAAENIRLNESAASLTTMRARLEGENQGLKIDVTKKELSLQNALDVNKEKEKTIQQKDDSITRLTQSLEDANSKADDAGARMQQAVKDATSLKLVYDQVNDLHSKQQIAMNDLQAELDALRITIKALEDRGVDVEVPNVPMIAGIVEAVSPEDQLVVISVGKDQKVEQGYEFMVHRGGQYVATLKVIQVLNDLSGARVLRTADNKWVEVGDQVKTLP